MSTENDTNQTRGGKREPSPIRGKRAGDRRVSSKKKDYNKNPIKTWKEQADKSYLLGDIIFKDASLMNGKVEPKNGQMPYLKSVWTEQGKKDEDVPPTVDIRSLELGALESMSRPNKRHMLRELAEKGKGRIEVRGINGNVLPKKFGEVRLVSLATVLILHVGLHKCPKNDYAGEMSAKGKNKDALFAELVGCADADTMKDLSDYLCPPLMTLEKLPDFIHCAIRQIARSQREDRSPEPVALAIQTVNAISAVLEQLNDEKEGKKKERFDELKSLLERTLAKARPDGAVQNLSEVEREARKIYFGRDLGCHAGLLLAGVQRYIYKAQGSVGNKKELCDLFIDASSGLLTGIPFGGFVFGSLGSAAKYGAHKWYFAYEAGKLGQLSRGVRQYFDEFIAAPIFFDGEFKERGKEGEEVKWEEFSKWYNQVISWNEMQNEMIECDSKEERKKEEKRKKEAKKERNEMKKRQ